MHMLEWSQNSNQELVHCQLLTSHLIVVIYLFQPSMLPYHHTRFLSSFSRISFFKDLFQLFLPQPYFPIFFGFIWFQFSIFFFNFFSTLLSFNTRNSMFSVHPWLLFSHFGFLIPYSHLTLTLLHNRKTSRDRSVLILSYIT